MSAKRKKINKTGRPPGWLEYTGHRTGEKIEAWQYLYSPKNVDGGDVEPDNINLSCDREGYVCWTDIRGLHDTKLLQELGEELGLSRLVMEDILHVGHPPKLESGKGFIVLSLKHISYENKAVEPIHVNIILTEGKVLSIADTQSEIFQAVRNRLEDDKNKLRTFGADHLFLRLADLIADYYLPYLSELRDQYDSIQERLISGEQGAVLQDVMELRSHLILLRQAILPLRAAMMELQNGMNVLISESAGPYLRDVIEHLQQAAEDQRALSDSVPMLLELHHANISNHMNSVMKTLTVIASIFIPLTFLAGIYGMNFEYMPELDIPWAYPALLGVMGIIVIGMLFYMRTKKWL